MSTKQFEAQKPHIHVGTIGRPGHGKTKLTTALSRVGSLRFGDAAVDYPGINMPLQVKFSGVAMEVSSVDYESTERRYTQYDWPGHADFAKCILSGAIQLDAAILVVST
jgi:elongation factor Tu